jgi:hypothetical protein
MENEFEKYLQQNRDQFEKGSPSPRVWEKLQRNLIEHQAHRYRIIRMRRIGWSVAAAILICLSLVIMLVKTEEKDRALVHNNTKDSSIMKRKLAAEIELDSLDRVKGITDYEARRSLFHYSRLIESRQKQMAILRQVNPDLYISSQKVLIDLNQQYRRLQKQLSGSPDRQKVLKALIENLKMQEQILNNQLQLLEELQTVEDTSDGKKIKKI